MMKFLLLFLISTPSLLLAVGSLDGEVKQQPLNISAIAMFLIFVGATLGITYWAAKRTKTAKDFYEAIFPYKYPALFSVSMAFISIWFFSITDKSDNAKKEIEAYERQYLRSQTGIGIDGALKH